MHATLASTTPFLSSCVTYLFLLIVTHFILFVIRIYLDDAMRHVLKFTHFPAQVLEEGADARLAGGFSAAWAWCLWRKDMKKETVYIFDQYNRQCTK